jgi:acyl dehydratase
MQVAVMECYEDIVVGAVSRFGQRHVTREEVLEFAGKYDPQPFHLSDEAAAATHFGRVSASGWHTCGMTMGMIAQENERTGHQGLGSPGIDELRWRHPVYPGDTLRVEITVLSKRRSQSRPEMGLFRAETRVFNQDDVVVMTMLSTGMVSTRDPAGTD